MEIEALATELAERWAPMMERMDWQERLRLLGEIHEKLLEDLGNFDIYAELSPRFIAKLVDRIGNGTVSSAEQAHVFANSGEARHRRASGEWFRRARAGEKPIVTVPDRRAAPRRPVNRPIACFAPGGDSFDCWLVNLSRSGALVTAPETPDMGSEVALDIPEVGTTVGDVVRVAPQSFALHFRAPLAEPALH